MARILFVSAPFGPFFKEFSANLERNGFFVWRMVFEGGDLVETPSRNRVMFSGSDEAWAIFVRRFMITHKIDQVVTFNDTLPRNAIALAVAKKIGVRRYVIENGYLRPYWVTFERDGVNGFSNLPRELNFYLNCDVKAPEYQAFASRLRPHVVNTVKHFFAAALFSPALPFNPSYYGDSILVQMRGYVREWFWRSFHDEQPMVKAITRHKSTGGKIFVCFMQKPGDSQLVVHSEYGGNVRFLTEVLVSFKRNRSPDSIIVIKQHPLDYGVEQSSDLVKALVRGLALEGKVFYLRKTSIDVVMPLADAVLTVNSTAGLASIAEGLPVACLGNAFYDIPGLTFDGSMDSFWKNPVRPLPEAVAGFLSYLKGTTQFNGGFHSKPARKLLISSLTAALKADSLAYHSAVQKPYFSSIPADLNPQSNPI